MGLPPLSQYESIGRCFGGVENISIDWFCIVLQIHQNFAILLFTIIPFMWGHLLPLKSIFRAHISKSWKKQTAMNLFWSNTRTTHTKAKVIHILNLNRSYTDECECEQHMLQRVRMFDHFVSLPFNSISSAMEIFYEGSIE